MHICVCFLLGDGTLRVWDVKSALCRLAVPAHKAEILSCDWCKYDQVMPISTTKECHKKYLRLLLLFQFDKHYKHFSVSLSPSPLGSLALIGAMALFIDIGFSNLPSLTACCVTYLVHVKSQAEHPVSYFRGFDELLDKQVLLIRTVACQEQHIFSICFCRTCWPQGQWTAASGFGI